MSESGHPGDKDAISIWATDTPIHDAVIVAVEIREDWRIGISLVKVQWGSVGNHQQDSDAEEEDDYGTRTEKTRSLS
jgi:hypothetical protein